MGDVLDLDLWIGLPDVHHDRVAALYPGRMRSGEPPDEFMRAFSSPGSVTQRTFTSPAGLHAVNDLNRPDAWALGNASMGGVGSARGLGKFYAMLANGGRWEGREIVPPAVLAALSHPLSQAEDAVLCRPIAFSAGMMQDPIETNGLQKRRSHYGSSLSAFGHPGAGGSLAFADPENGIAFAYVMNQMEIGVLPGEKSLGMVRCLYAD
jgi:CubicO group peptidase (beta-lactamase class C family)